MGRLHRFLVGGRVILSERPPTSAAVRLRRRHHPTAPTTISASTPSHNMAHSVPRWCSAGPNFAIVDEVDSILIDEARNPR